MFPEILDKSMSELLADPMGLSAVHGNVLALANPELLRIPEGIEAPTGIAMSVTQPKEKIPKTLAKKNMNELLRDDEKTSAVHGAVLGSTQPKKFSNLQEYGVKFLGFERREAQSSS